MWLLLWGRVPGQIAAIVTGRDTEEIERMFLGGVEMVARTEEDQCVSRKVMDSLGGETVALRNRMR